MSLRELQRIFDRTAEAAQAGEPLPEALDALGGTLAPALAADLRTGTSFADALGNQIPAEIRALLAGPRPDLAESALLASAWVRGRRERRERLTLALLHPLLTVALFAGLLIAARERLTLDLDRMWLLAVALPLAVIPLIGCVPRLASAIPLLGGWMHAALMSERWQRAGLAAHWRLHDAHAEALVGNAWPLIRPILGRRDAVDHCRRMATLQANRARRHLNTVVLVSTTGMYLIAGMVLLSAASGSYQELLNRVMHLTEGSGE